MIPAISLKMKSEEFTSSGTWTKPDNVEWIYVILVAGGMTRDAKLFYKYGAIGLFSILKSPLSLNDATLRNNFIQNEMKNGIE